MVAGGLEHRRPNVSSPVLEGEVPCLVSFPSLCWRRPCGFWPRRLSLRRKIPRNKKPQPPAAEALPAPAEREAAIEKALASPTQIEFVETPLQDVIDYLKDYHHIEIQIDTKAFNDAGVDPSTTISKNLKGISLRSALNSMLRELELTYVIQDEVLLTSVSMPRRSMADTAGPNGSSAPDQSPGLRGSDDRSALRSRGYAGTRCGASPSAPE